MKIFKLFLLTFVAILVSITACDEKNLDVEPVNKYLSENFFQTEDQVLEALVAAYDPIGWTMAFGQWISEVMYGEIRSDNANAGGDPSDNDQPGWQELDDFRETTSNTILQPIYRKYYIGIFRANAVLFLPEITSEQVDIYQAEAKFLRAYYHFKLFQHFGPIPLVTSLLTPDDVNLTRSKRSEIFEAIVQDLQEAIEVLPITLSSSQIGRATKGSAQALLGKVYIHWADMDNDDAAKFDLAAAQLQAVVTSGQYALVDDYGTLFSAGVKNTSEAVFEIQKSNLWPSDWGWFEGIEGNGIVQLCGIRGLCTDHPFYEAGWGFMLPTSDLYDSYLPDDTVRRGATLISEAELIQTIQDSGLAASCDVVVDITQSNLLDFTGYWQQKYANFKTYTGNNVNGGDPNLTKDPNVHEIRYADVLLLLAEALHRGTGGDADAMTNIDIVRERAAGPGDNTGSFRTASQVMADEGWTLLDLIWYERRAELAMEGHRWFDLVRSGQANADLFAGDPIRGANFNETRMWLPISLEETAVARGLDDYPDDKLFD